MLQRELECVNASLLLCFVSAPHRVPRPPGEGLTKAFQSVQLAMAKQSKLHTEAVWWESRANTNVGWDPPKRLRSTYYWMTIEGQNIRTSVDPELKYAQNIIHQIITHHMCNWIQIQYTVYSCNSIHPFQKPACNAGSSCPWLAVDPTLRFLGHPLEPNADDTTAWWIDRCTKSWYVMIWLIMTYRQSAWLQIAYIFVLKPVILYVHINILQRE